MIFSIWENSKIRLYNKWNFKLIKILKKNKHQKFHGIFHFSKLKYWFLEWCWTFWTMFDRLNGSGVGNWKNSKNIHYCNPPLIINEIKMMKFFINDEWIINPNSNIRVPLTFMWFLHYNYWTWPYKISQRINSIFVHMPPILALNSRIKSKTSTLLLCKKLIRLDIVGLSQWCLR